MSARIYEALLACDDARYSPDGDLPSALAVLRIIVFVDTDEARAMLGRLQGCRRTVQRHLSYLNEVLSQ